MRTKTFKEQFVNKVMVLALFFILPFIMNSQMAMAQTSGNSLVCDPIPEDPELILACIDQWNAPSIYNGNPDTVQGVANGVHGMSTAYDTINNRMLFVSTDGRHVQAQLYDASGTTLTKIGNIFQVDQSNLYAGAPKVIFNEQAKHYFAVWADARPGRTLSDSSVYGRFISLDGTFLGNDFPIHNGSNMYLSDLAYDSVNQKYLFMLEANENVYMRTATITGTVSELVTLQNSQYYEGQSSIVYNPDRNEYWYTYTWCTLNDTAQEDCRIMLARLNATTLQNIDQPIQLSQIHLGHNVFSSPQIEYSPIDQGAVVAWNEGGKNPGMVTEVYGRTVWNDLSITNEYPILSSYTSQTSDFYGGSKNLAWNPYTNTFMLAGENNNGGTTYAEFMSDGTVLDVREPIAYQSGSTGTFNPGLGITPNGAYIYGTIGHANPVIATVVSPFTLTEPKPVTIDFRKSADLDSKDIAKMLTQIYLYSLGLAGMLAVAVTVWGSYLIMTSRGNAAQVSSGKEYISSAVIGLLLLFAAFIILNTLNSDLTSFDIPNLNLLK